MFYQKNLARLLRCDVNSNWGFTIPYLSCC
jgi:hypothetical protein